MSYLAVLGAGKVNKKNVVFRLRNGVCDKKYKYEKLMNFLH